ncbi:uncharacterized protein LOC119066842 [Bradysia coprophila]|uniref:uncharacterized protein LOC119066842 n=1 Tax=Bradysia coprophila TaxID=38358 RepID=UPI00187DB906|nr:uncharacterized protein LOC119066842 [Bradysia coprophila]
MNKDDDNSGANKFALMIASLLLIATACVCFSCYRICVVGRMRKKQQRLPPIEDIRIENINQAPPTSHVTATQQSDHQLVLNISTTSAINQNSVRRCPLAELQNEYERRTLERSTNLSNKDSSLPPYSSKDDSLPSYDQVIRNGADDNNLGFNR